MKLFSPHARTARGALIVGAALALGGDAAQVLAAPTLDAQDQKVIDRLNWVLNKRVQRPDGKKINVSIVPTARASEGYFQQIKMSGAPAQLKKRFRVSEFALDARNVRLDVPALWDRRVKTYAATTRLRAVITQDDLTNNLANGKHTKTMNLKIRFLGGQIGVTGNLNYALINGPISGVAKLRLAPGHKVYLDILSLKLRGVEVPGFIKNQFSGHINPVISYEDLPFKPPFKSIQMVGSKAILST